MSGNLTVRAGCRSAQLNAVVQRCGCSDAQKARADWHGRLSQPCPRPRAVDDLGTVAYYHRNPLRVLAWRIGRIFRQLTKG